MSNILLYLGLGLGGYLSGALVNFIVDSLYLRRRFVSEEFADFLGEGGWIKYLSNPFSVSSAARRFQVRVLIVEIIFTGLLLWFGLARPDRVEFWWGLPVLIYFAVVIVMDIEFRIVMHPVSWAGAALGLGVGIYLRGPVVTLLGGAIGYALMFLLYKLGEIFVKVINRRRGTSIDDVALGFGDVNMSGVVGLFLGWPPIFLGLLVAVITAGLVSVILIGGALLLRRYRAFAAMPYAPFLALAALVMLFFPEWVGGLMPGV
jgi:leader peptidase (prepilin peptidase)/N-methyltransferase